MVMLSEMQHQNLEPNVISVSAAIIACAEGEQQQLALGMLSGMQQRKLEANVMSFNTAISTCERGYQLK